MFVGVCGCLCEFCVGLKDVGPKDVGLKRVGLKRVGLKGMGSKGVGLRGSSSFLEIKLLEIFWKCESWHDRAVF